MIAGQKLNDLKKHRTVSGSSLHEIEPFIVSAGNG
jgi:hypothetical protein